ncbi:hypothetical protein EA58_20235 [Photobacterium galatheae]|uniref:Uncharacterized protein n=1 Tax=Photobacterium galatheae TaxID=1654360 RepID=A0A066RQX4_9GAMM|nr:hypothetical protein EA58_20235 [Photobacterium galatheae]
MIEIGSADGNDAHPINHSNFHTDNAPRYIYRYHLAQYSQARLGFGFHISTNVLNSSKATDREGVQTDEKNDVFTPFNPVLWGRWMQLNIARRGQ